MQSRNKEPDNPDESVLKEMRIMVQVVDANADMKQYSLDTGNIILSTPKEISIEAMRYTGTVIPDKKPAHIALCLRDFIAEAPEAGILEKEYLTHGFFAAHFADTVISECAIYFLHTVSEEYLPIRILSAKMIFEDDRELDYSDKISAYVMDSLAKGEW